MPAEAVLRNARDLGGLGERDHPLKRKSVRRDGGLPARRRCWHRTEPRCGKAHQAAPRLETMCVERRDQMSFSPAAKMTKNGGKLFRKIEGASKRAGARHRHAALFHLGGDSLAGVPELHLALPLARRRPLLF